jgi:hypothetical protein
MITGNGTYPNIIECKTLAASDHVIIGSTILGYDRLRFYDVILTGEKINNYDKVVENHYKMLFGLGNKDNILSSNFIGMYNDSKDIYCNLNSSGIYIDSSSNISTSNIRNSVSVGNNNYFGTESSCFYNTIYGINNGIIKTKEGHIFGKDNYITTDISDSNYSVICGSNNTIYDTRAFIFGRDNDLSGPRNNSYTTPSIVIGNNNDNIITKGKSIVIGSDIGTNLSLEDGISNCIIIGNGKHNIEPFTMHIGADEITNVYLYGVQGTGNILQIDSDGRLSKTVIESNEPTKPVKDYDDLYFISTDGNGPFFGGSYGLVNNNSFLMWFPSDYNVGNFNFYLRFCIKKSDVDPRYRPYFTAEILGNLYDNFSSTVSLEGLANGTRDGVTEEYYKYNIIISHRFDNQIYNMKDMKIKLTRYYELAGGGGQIGLTGSAIVSF